MLPLRYIIDSSGVSRLLGVSESHDTATTVQRLREDGRTHFPVMPFVSGLIWRIPGVKSVDTWHNIADKFTEAAAARKSEPLVDPRALFMAGQLILGEDNARVAVPIRGFFGQ